MTLKKDCSDSDEEMLHKLKSLQADAKGKIEVAKQNVRWALQEYEKAKEDLLGYAPSTQSKTNSKGEAKG